MTPLWTLAAPARSVDGRLVDLRPRVDAGRAAPQRPVGGGAVVLDPDSPLGLEETGVHVDIALAGIAALHVAERDGRGGLVA